MSAETQSGSPATCLQHPEALAECVCARCQTAVCVECCYSLPDKSVCCKSCYHAEPKPTTSPASILPSTPPPLRLATLQPVGQQAFRPAATMPGQSCVQHPNVMSVARCQSCGVGSCRTCDFVFPGNLHYCPVCVASATNKLSPRRKKYLIAAYILAAWSSLGFVGFLGGAAAGLTEAMGTGMLGMLFLLLVGLPAIIGTATGMSARRPGGPNSIAVWIALVWNALVLGGMVLLIIIGNLK